MNNFLASECSADCESGWTPYLEQSFLSHPIPKHRNNTNLVDAKGTGFCSKGKNSKEKSEDEEEEEDLSMVSDASSGPPHFHEDESYLNYDNGYFYPSLKDTTLLSNGANYRPKKKEHKRHKQDQELPSFLDDTASSPAFNFSKQNNFALSNNQASMESVLEYSQGFSATHFQGRSAYQDHIGYIHPSLSGNQLQNSQLSGFKGRIIYGDCALLPVIGVITVSVALKEMVERRQPNVTNQRGGGNEERKGSLSKKEMDLSKELVP